MDRIVSTETDEAGAATVETRMERVTMLLTGLLEWNNEQFEARLRSLSRTGAEIAAAMTPAVGSAVRFSRGLAELSGTVVAITGTRFEIEFDGYANLDLLRRRLAAQRPADLPSHRFDRETRDWLRPPISKH